MSMNDLRSEFLLHLTTQNWKRSESRSKKSFWPTDSLKPACEIWWKWMDVQETEPIAPEKLLMFSVAGIFEHEIIKTLVATGNAVDLSNADLCNKMGLSVIQRDGDVPQIRLKMEREFIPITGYLDGITPKGYPIEIKTHYSSKVDNDLANGKSPSEQYLHQLAIQMDFVGALKGILVSANRATGLIFFSELKRDSQESLLFYLSDTSAGGIVCDEDSEEFDIPESGKIETEQFCFDLCNEYVRWRKLMEDYIIPVKEPPLDYEYRPEITKKFLNNYDEAKVKKAIKGDRVLSDHRWQPQYCNWKTRWAEIEAKQKGFKSVSELCAYSDADIKTMMDWGGWEFRTDKNGKRKLFKSKK